MAGSLKNVVYKSDKGVEYVVALDESNSELTEIGFRDYTELDDTLGALPKNIKMRYVNVLNVATGAQRKLYCGTSIAARFVSGGVLLLALVANVSGAGALLPFTITSAIGEFVRLLNPTDTGLVDDDLD